MSSKAVKAAVRLLIPAGQAKPAPPVGPALGQAGLNIMQFCKDFNARTADIKPGTMMRVTLTAYVDKSFEYVRSLQLLGFTCLKLLRLQDACSKAHNRETGQGVQVVKSPPSSHFIRAAAGIQAGSAQSTGPPVGSISLKHLYEIAKVKQKDDETIPLRSWCKQLIGTCQAMGVKVVRSPEDAVEV